MKIFFDTEFCGLFKDTELISVGLVDEDGNQFYAEISDFTYNKAENWIKLNIIPKLLMNDIKNMITIEPIIVNGENRTKKTIKDTFLNVRKELKSWLNKYDTVEFVSDVCHYDFVLLIDLVYGHALQMPYGKHCSACYDINQAIAEYYGISEIEAFDKTREDIITEYNENVWKEENIIIDGAKHNAIYDALVIKAIYDIINK